MQRAATTYNKPQRATTTHNDHSKNRLLQLFSLSLNQLNFSCILCFIYNKIIISCFHRLLFLFFNAILFSFVKQKFLTYRNSCLPSHLTKIRASSKNNKKLRFLSKKLKICQTIYFQLSDYHHSLIKHMHMIRFWSEKSAQKFTVRNFYTVKFTSNMQQKYNASRFCLPIIYKTKNSIVFALQLYFNFQRYQTCITCVQKKHSLPWLRKLSLLQYLK